MRRGTRLQHNILSRKALYVVYASATTAPPPSPETYPPTIRSSGAGALPRTLKTVGYEYTAVLPISDFISKKRTGSAFCTSLWKTLLVVRSGGRIR
jgi:hypothetical protein